MENFAVKTEAKPVVGPRFSWRRNFYRAPFVVFRKTCRLDIRIIVRESRVVHLF